MHSPSVSFMLVHTGVVTALSRTFSKSHWVLDADAINRGVGVASVEFTCDDIALSAINVTMDL